MFEWSVWTMKKDRILNYTHCKIVSQNVSTLIVFPNIISYRKISSFHNLLNTFWHFYVFNLWPSHAFIPHIFLTCEMWIRLFENKITRNIILICVCLCIGAIFFFLKSIQKHSHIISVYAGLCLLSIVAVSFIQFQTCNRFWFWLMVLVNRFWAWSNVQYEYIIWIAYL